MKKEIKEKPICVEISMCTEKPLINILTMKKKHYEQINTIFPAVKNNAKINILGQVHDNNFIIVVFTINNCLYTQEISTLKQRLKSDFDYDLKKVKILDIYFD